MKNLSIIIPCAGKSSRFQNGQKVLVEINNRPLILRQLDVLRKVFPQADYVVIVGYEGDKVRSILPPWVRIIENENYETTNVARSLALGIQATLCDNLLVCYGDLVFNTDIFAHFPLKESSVLIQSQARRTYEVGVSIEEGCVSNFSYGLESIWAHIMFLTGWEKRRFAKLTLEAHRKSFGFEVLNELLSKGGRLKAVAPTCLKLAEIDTPADLKQARTLFLA